MNLFRKIARWAGLLTMLFGGGTIVWAIVVLVQYETGWGLTLIEQRNGGNIARAALGMLLSGMFFFLVGAGIVLVSRYDRPGARSPEEPTPRWTKPVTVLLAISGVASIALATLFAGMTAEFGDATPGIVSYCMLIGVGLLFSAWGLKRAGDRDEKPELR